MALKVRVRLDGNDQKEVALLPARVASFAFRCHTDTGAVRRAGWNANCLFLLAAPVQHAFGALEGFFERNLDSLFQVTPLDRLLIGFAGAPATAKDCGKEIRKVRAALVVINAEATIA